MPLWTYTVPFLSCPVSCEADLCGVHLWAPFHSGFWLGSARGRQEQKLLGERRVELGIYSPYRSLWGGRGWLHPSSTTQVHSCQAAALSNSSTHSFLLLPFKSRGGYGPCYSLSWSSVPFPVAFLNPAHTFPTVPSLNSLQITHLECALSVSGLCFSNLICTQGNKLRKVNNSPEVT